MTDVTVLCVIVSAQWALVAWLHVRLLRLEKVLWHVRMATFELTTMLGDSVKDLEETLDEVGIQRRRRHVMERMRWMMLTHEEKNAEFNAKMTELQRKWRKED